MPRDEHGCLYHDIDYGRKSYRIFILPTEIAGQNEEAAKSPANWHVFFGNGIADDEIVWEDE